MEVSTLRNILLQFKGSNFNKSPNCLNKHQCIKDVKELDGNFAFLTVKKQVSRRQLLVWEFIGISLATVNLYARPALAAAPMQDMTEPEVIRTLRQPNGVIIQDIVEGEGREAREGDLVEVNYVCRRSNGYFVHSTVDQFSGVSSPVVLPLDDNQIIKGLKEVLIGMKVGGKLLSCASFVSSCGVTYCHVQGKRRALIPPSVGYINESLQPIPDEFGPRRSLLSHANEPLVFEVQVLKLL